MTARVRSGSVRGMWTISAVALALFVVGTVTAGEPEWVAKVPDFRSSWPPPLAIGSAVPDFTLEDLAGGKKVNLTKARAGKRATLVLFLDDNCSTCKRRGADLATSLAAVQRVDGAAALVVFVTNLARTGAKGALAFAEKAKLPAVPLLSDDHDGTSETALAWRVSVTPCAAVLDAEGKLAYFGLALEQTGADLLPGVVGRVADSKAVEGPAVRPPFG